MARYWTVCTAGATTGVAGDVSEHVITEPHPPVTDVMAAVIVPIIAIQSFLNHALMITPLELNRALSTRYYAET
jgi:hypothetical protein